MGIRLTQFLGWDKDHHHSSSSGQLAILFQLSSIDCLSAKPCCTRNSLKNSLRSASPYLVLSAWREDDSQNPVCRREFGSAQPSREQPGGIWSPGRPATDIASSRLTARLSGEG